MKIIVVVSYFLLLVLFHANGQYPMGNAPQNQSNKSNNLSLAKGVKDTIAAPWNHLTIYSDSRINKLLSIRKEENLRKRGFDGKPGMDGFRLQIFQGPKDKADLIYSKFLSKYPDQVVYEIFQTPDFKVRIGDFRERSEAIHLQYLIEKDFPNPLIVEDVINFPALKKESDLKGEL
ncbi:MAG: hypothetical protein ACERKD_10910 [Prolixibacteraceae bacterium]